MKKVYYLTFVGMAFIAALTPKTISAQCTCSGGLPATGITQSVSIPYTKASQLTFTFNQFDPSIGDLSCVRLYDTISAITISGAHNLALDTVAYLWQLTAASKVSGPGILINKVFNGQYGYDTLAPDGDPADTVTHGPDNVFTNQASTAQTGGNAAYIGMGTVDFTYKINGGLIALDGGLNYLASVTTTIAGTFNLTYYWCPSNPLATSITYFSAIKKDRAVQLEWLAANLQNNTNYEVQFSKNGEDFSPIGSVPTDPSAAGTITEYHYQYNLNPTDVGSIYFRIKRIDENGKISYSAVKLINLQSTGSMGIQTYPNPMVSSVKVQFDEVQNGHFMLELVNISGQVVEQKAMTLDGTNLVEFTLFNHPAKGLYVLRAKDLSHNTQFLTKVQVE
ncbi:MAG: choice-of-anchor E domain-containing protein [Chitinophagales bacterium]